MAVAITRTSDPASAATTAGNVVVYSATAGAAATDRLLIVPIGMENATPAVVNRVTIDTGAGAVDMDRAGAPATLASMGAWVYWKLVPTGTAATISITWSAAVLAAENHVCLYAVTGANTGGLVSYTSNTSTDMDVTAPLAATITIATGGGAIAIAACASTTAGSHTWANMTADLDDGTANFRFNTATRTTAGAGLAVTLTGALNGEDGALAVIVLGPTPTAVAGLGYKYPLPLLVPYPVNLRTWLEGTTAFMADSTRMPSRVTDWGLQPAAFQRPPTGKFWVQEPQITPNPFSQESWPNPILRTWQPPPHPLQFSPVTPQPPFMLDDWPLPQRPTYQPPQHPVQFRPTAAVTAQEFMPSRVTDWGAQAIPVPRPDWVAQINTPLFAPALRTGPFNQFDWPPPKYPHLLRRHDWLAQLNVPLLSLIYVAREATFQKYFGTPTVNFAWQTRSNIALQAGPAVSYMPGRVMDWGAPPVAVVLAQKSASSNISLLTATPQPPFYQTSWPQPIRIPPIGQFWTARAQIEFVQAPFSQTNWPNPIQPINITSQRTWISSTIGLLNQLRVGPFNQFSWPLPIPPEYPTSGRTWIGRTIGLRNQVRTGPFNQFSWPVPQRPGQPGSVYFFKNSPIEITPAPITEVPVDTHDGVFDERKWREYQERLRRQREKLDRQEKERRTKLRAELVRLYRGLDEVGQPAEKPKLPRTKQEPLPIPVLDYIGLAAPQVSVQNMVAEYVELLRREQVRREQEDEDELETILMATLL